MLDNIKAIINKYFLPSFLIVTLKLIFFRNINKYKFIKDLNMLKILLFIYLSFFEDYLAMIFISYRKFIAEIVSYFYYFSSKIVRKVTIN